jgi:hypothetical protein
MKQKIRIEIKLPWWIWPYIYGVNLMSWITRLEPDAEKVHHWLKKAAKVKEHVTKL